MITDFWKGNYYTDVCRVTFWSKSKNTGKIQPQILVENQYFNLQNTFSTSASSLVNNLSHVTQKPTMNGHPPQHHHYDPHHYHHRSSSSSK